MNHQAITKILGDAGMKPQRFTKRIRQHGYQVAQIGRSVGILCGPYSTDEVSRLLVSKGFSVSQRPNASTDALFVGVA